MPIKSRSRLRRCLRWGLALLVLLMMATVVGAFAFRSHRIAAVPDVPEPFAVAAFGYVAVADGESADDKYALAAAAFKPWTGDTATGADGQLRWRRHSRLTKTVPRSMFPGLSGVTVAT